MAQGRTQQTGQTPGWDMYVHGSGVVPPVLIVLIPRLHTQGREGTTKQGHKSGITLQHHMRRLGYDLGKTGSEEQLISYPLLGMNEQRTPGQRSAVPARLRQ